MADPRDEGINWVKDEQLWVDAGEDPTEYLRLLRLRGSVSPPHDQPIEYDRPHEPVSIPTIAGGMP